MERQILFAFSLILVAAILNSGVALKCYDCMKCNDPFKKDQFKATDCSGVCMKVKMTADGLGMAKGDVIRQCLRVGEKIKSKCEEGQQGGYKGEVCFCDTDECNGSDVTKFTIATGIMAVVAVLKNMNRF